MTAIEIVSYDGEYPNLCFGRLKLKADGKEYVTSPGVLCPGEGAECYCDENWDEVVNEVVLRRLHLRIPVGKIIRRRAWQWEI